METLTKTTELTAKNDWEYIYYYVNDKRVNSKKITKVWLSDGTEMKPFDVFIGKRHSSYSDMGHLYSVSQEDVIYIKIQVTKNVHILSNLEELLSRNNNIKAFIPPDQVSFT